MMTNMRTDDERWAAVLRRDSACDEDFYYSVRSTGVYCRPSCAARRPLRRNVRFYPTARAAERDGLRPCQRCRPLAEPVAALWPARRRGRVRADSGRLRSRAAEQPRAGARGR